MSDSVFRNYIAGEWVEGNNGSVANISPADLSDVIGQYAQADKAQTEAAIAAATKGQQEWAKSGLEQRYSVLMAIGDELIARKDELGEILAREEGKLRKYYARWVKQLILCVRVLRSKPVVSQ